MLAFIKVTTVNCLIRTIKSVLQVCVLEGYKQLQSVVLIQCINVILICLFDTHQSS